LAPLGKQPQPQGQAAAPCLPALKIIAINRLHILLSYTRRYSEGLRLAFRAQGAGAEGWCRAHRFAPVLGYRLHEIAVHVCALRACCACFLCQIANIVALIVATYAQISCMHFAFMPHP